MSADPASWAFRVPGMDLDSVSDALDIAGILANGLSEERGVTTAWFGDDRPPSMPIDGEWESVARHDWSEKWKDGLDPVTVRQVTVTPPWLAPHGPVVEGPPFTIVIEPGMAFGTGHHETTMGCLDAMQDLDLAGKRVIDVGTGTGVLAIAARMLGATDVVAVDIDPEAVAVARENLAAHPVDRITLLHGSTDVVEGPGDVVIANIITDLLLALLPQLLPLVAPGGTLLTSGIAVARTDEAVAEMARHGLDATATAGREWAVVTARHATRKPQDPGLSPGS